VVEFPPSDRPVTESEIDKLFLKNFIDLEGRISDVARMGEIARNLIANCAAREDKFHDLELATFAVWQLAKMLKQLQADYQAALARRNRSGQRLISCRKSNVTTPGASVYTFGARLLQTGPGRAGIGAIRGAYLGYVRATHQDQIRPAPAQAREGMVHSGHLSRWRERADIRLQKRS
jgi:hypothetical protein